MNKFFEVAMILANAEAHTAEVARRGTAPEFKSDLHKQRWMAGVFVTSVRQAARDTPDFMATCDISIWNAITNCDFWLDVRAPNTNHYRFYRLDQDWKEFFMGQQGIELPSEQRMQQEIKALIAEARTSESEMQKPVNTAQYLASLGDSCIEKLARFAGDPQ